MTLSPEQVATVQFGQGTAATRQEAKTDTTQSIGSHGADSEYGSENGETSWDRLIGGPGGDSLQDPWTAAPNNLEFDAVCGDDGNDTMNIADDNGGSQVEADQYYGGAGTDTVVRDAWDNSVSADTCHG